MSITDTNRQAFVGQDDFSGGMNCMNPAANQCIEIINGTLRHNKRITTRGGMRSYLKLAGGFLVGFYFNQENAKVTDATHDGFWFPFDFVKLALVTTIQGIEFIRLSIHDYNRLLFVSDGNVFLYEDGYVTTIPCSATLASTEEITFTQMVDKIYMFRGEDLDELVWDGSSTGFTAIAAPDTGSPIVKSKRGVFHSGRMWITNGDDVYASDLLDAETYDYVYASWGISKQQEDAGVTLYPFHESGILCFKKKRITLLSGINSNVLVGTKFSDYVTQISVDEHTGCIAPNTIVTIGEDVWYLGYNGINSLVRNQQSKIELTPVAISAAMQNYIDRINWNAADKSCAMVHDNYVIFGIPIDGATSPNICLVFDKQLGAWAGVWSGALMNPIRFLKDNEVPLLLSANNVLRRMFTTDPWDSEDPYGDTPAWDATKVYQGNGELVYYEYNGDQIYRSIQTSLNQAPTNATYWELAGDVRHLYEIQTYVKSRQFTWEQIKSLMRFFRADVLFKHRNPQISLSVHSADYNTDTLLYNDKVYPQNEYDTGGVPNWDDTNINLDFNEPHRKDYTLIIDSDGIWLDSDGIYTGIWETHTLPFIPVITSQQSIGVEITNDRGMIEVCAIRIMAEPRRFNMFKTV